jgi:hypothetical protein
MMHKTITQIFCDDCGKEIQDKGHVAVIIPCAELDFCCICVKERILHSVSLISVGRKCKECGGKGQVKDFYGHNDYHWKDCEVCKGMRVTPLK